MYKLLLTIFFYLPFIVNPQEISFDENNPNLEVIISEIESQTDLKFAYGNDVNPTTKLVGRFSFEKGNLDEVLNQFSKRTPYALSIIGNNIAISVDPPVEKSEPIKMTQILVVGKVTDANGLPLPSVTVQEQGTNNGVLTDFDGNFSIEVGSNESVLVFTFIGMQTLKKTVEGNTSMNIQMQEDEQALDEVVVIGYGSIERKDLTGAVSSVGGEEIRELAATRVDQALLGKVAGVQVKPVSGAPGAAPQIRIRGIGSISAGGDPLYVVDGFPVDDIQTLNPNDIASIDVLKDASATAIYGSRGANGVVIITTVRGRSGEARITYDTYYGMQQVMKIPHFMNAREQAEYAYHAVRNRNLDLGNDISGPETSWGFPMPPTVMDVIEGRNTTDVNAIEEILRTAPQLQHQISATGGNENVKYALSGEYLNQEGIIINSGFTRYSARANIDVKLTEKLDVRLSLNPSYTEQWGHEPSGTGYGTSILGNAASVNPYNPIYNESGDYFVYRGLPEVGDFPNPVALAQEIVSERKRMRFIGNMNIGYSISDDLKLNVMLGGNTGSSRSLEFIPHLPSFLNATASGTDATSMTYNWLTEYLLNYNKSFGDHKIAGLAGFSVQNERGESNFLSSNRFSNNLVTTLSGASGLINDGSADIYEWSLISYLARINYNYNDKYYLTGSIRTDGSSRFGSDRKYGVFPSVAAAWRISEESFFNNVNFVNGLKLRASYGETGNNNIGNYEHIATVNNVLYPLGNSAVSGYRPARLRNPSLTWEKQKSVNIGLDAGIFNDRVRLSVDHFRSRNSDLLLYVNVPAVTGFSSALTNIGEVENTGFEFVVSTVNIAKEFQWSTDFNFSTYQNEVLSLGPKGDPIISNTHITQIGQPIGMFYGILTDGIFETQEELNEGPLYQPNSSAGTHLGDIKFVDLSGPDGVPDGLIDSYDRTIMGSPYPEFYYGMTNRFSYRNWNLSIGLQGVQGNQILSEAMRVSMRGEFRVNQLAVLNNFWRSEQDPGDSPRPNDEPTGGIRQISERFLDDGSYLRINNISLGYVVPETFSERLGLSALRFYVNATNPFIFTDNLGFNPDVSSNESALAPGVDNNSYPLAKSLLLGLNVTFN